MWLRIDPESTVSLSRQLYSKIKELILEGKLHAGEKLPSTRALARELQISRNTVLEAYDQLIAEGYLEGHHGSGTLVAEGIQLTKPLPKPSSVPMLHNPAAASDRIDFRSGIPDLAKFPRKEWARLYQQVCHDISDKALRYHSSAGATELRVAIAGYLLRSRGISCDPSDIMIVSGSTQGLSLIGRLLSGSKSEVIVEDPIHHGLLNVISSCGYRISSIPADEDGLDTRLLKPSAEVSFLYTTPSHQYPLGGILPIQRRQALIRYAIENNCYIVEDDYDSEFRYEGHPVSSLYELMPERVIYLGSFSKILAPALRLGYILLPKALHDRYRLIKMYSDVHTEVISQYILAEFIQNGGLEKHIRKMKKLYSMKRKLLLQELEKHFSGEYEIKGHAAGLHVLVHFHQVRFTKELLSSLMKHQVRVYPVEDFAVERFHLYEQDIILGYSHLSQDEIIRGIQLLREVIHKKTDEAGTAHP
jgi:GntR family transcriptional regulator/MocR family aminotransferase